MRLHRLIVAGSLLSAGLCAGIASAQSVLDQPKTAETAPRAKKDEAAHAPLFLEQKELPATSKAAMRDASTRRLFSKSKD